MLDAVVINAGAVRAKALRYLVGSCGALHVHKDFDSVPNPIELQRLLNVVSPQVLIVDLEAYNHVECIALIRRTLPQAAIVGFGGSTSSSFPALSAGLNEIVADTAGPAELHDAIESSLRQVGSGVDKSLFSFIPAKAGSGSSTIVLNAAIAYARLHSRRVLVIDADLRSGILAALLGVTPHKSLEYVLDNISFLDARGIAEAASRIQNVDFLFSSRCLDAPAPEWSNYFNLLSLVRPLYDAIFVDLPELVNPATLEIVRRSGTIFVVTTPEPPALSLASQRLKELGRIKLPQDRIRLLLNRAERAESSLAEVQRWTGMPAYHLFPNDYPSVRSSTLAHTCVSPRTRLGQAFDNFAGRLVRGNAPAASGFSDKLRDLFSLAR